MSLKPTSSAAVESLLLFGGTIAIVGGWGGGGSLQNCLVDGVVYRPDIDMNHRTQGFLEVKWIDLIKFTYPVVLIAAVWLCDT